MKLLPHSPIPVYPLTGHLDSLSGLGLKAILDRRDDLKLPCNRHVKAATFPMATIQLSIGGTSLVTLGTWT